MTNLPETLEDLDELVNEVIRKGFRIAYLDPLSDDPLAQNYVPALDKDGVKEHEAPELLRKAQTVSLIRKWVDLRIVGPDLEPIIKLEHSAKPNIVNGQIDNSQLSVEEILAQARIGVPAKKTVFSEFDNEDRFDRACEKVAQAYGLPLSKLRRIAIAEDIDGVENIEAALVQIAESIRAGA